MYRCNLKFRNAKCCYSVMARPEAPDGSKKRRTEQCKTM